MRVTIDRSLEDDLETLRNLLGHTIRDGDLAEVLREAIRCGIDKHGKRRGAVRPARTRKAPPARRSDDPRAIPAELRRQVWERDGGRCAFVGHDGRRCESRFQLEVDHVDAVGASDRKSPTLDRLRLACRPHNFRYAERVYGREQMARFRRTRTGEFTIAGDSAPKVKPSCVES
jgi:5-methylcytosine-specific restriction endonuclease McrA